MLDLSALVRRVVSAIYVCVCVYADVVVAALCHGVSVFGSEGLGKVSSMPCADHPTYLRMYACTSRMYTICCSYNNQLCVYVTPRMSPCTRSCVCLCVCVRVCVCVCVNTEAVRSSCYRVQ